MPGRMQGEGMRRDIWSLTGHSKMMSGSLMHRLRWNSKAHCPRYDGTRTGTELSIKSHILGCLLSLFVLSHPFSADAQQLLRMIGPEDVGEAWGEVIRRFHAKHPEINIEYISGPWSSEERQNMYIRSFLGGDPIELVYMDVVWTAKFAAQGWLLPLDKLFPPDKREAFLPADLEAGFHGDHF